MHPLLKKRFVILGIVNVTPDSFFDGGKYASVDAAVKHGLALVEDGANVLDIGGESTRPGAPRVSEGEEKGRILPVVGELSKRCGAAISVDTTKASVARDALDAGASWVNDVSAGRFDSAMPALVAERRCPVILMHSRETPATMQKDPFYNDAVAEVKQELLSSVERFRAAGVERDDIILDPGIGFAKRLEDNLAVLSALDAIVALGYPVCIGTSRKSFIGHLTGRAAPDRLAGSLAGVAAAFLRGARLFRVHDVRETADVLTVLDAIANGTRS